jgi:hypothetical protein
MNLMNKSFWAVFVLMLPLLSTQVHSQTFTIEGITGIEFDTTGGDYSISVTDNFTVFGINVIPGSLTLTYTEADEHFEIDGTITTSFDGEEIDAELDFVIENESLQSVVFNVTTSFEIRSLTIAPDTLGFEWLGGTDFGIYGSATATLDGNEMSVKIGEDSAMPGIAINNGSITAIDLTVNGSFEVKSITIAPEDLTFSYSSDDSQYEMYGSATTTIDGNEIALSFGDSDDPGLILNSGSLTHINFGITAEFDMKGITISPSDLTFQYDQTEDYYEFFGDVSVKFDGEEIDANLGDSDDPGIVFDSGTITHVNFSVSTDFEIKDLTISPSDLTFQYDSSEDYFEMFGDVSVKFDEEEVDASFGDSDKPGLVYENGSITQVDFSLTGDFSVKSLTISPDSLTFEYDATEDYFEMYGSATTSVDDNELDLNVGDADDPGVILDNGTLTHLNFGVTSNFEMKGITISPTDLTFQYDLTEEYYEFFGEVSIQLDGNDIDANLGDADDPGIVFSSGTITHVNFGITANFDVKTITIAPNDLTFGYDSGEDYFEMYGSATTSVDGNDIELSFGDADDPGLIQERGTLTHINFGITADFDMKGTTISPSDLTFQYDQTEDYYEFFGDVSVKFDGEEIDASLGDADDPGIVFDSGTITHVNFSLTADFEVKDLAISPDNLTFEYDSGEEYFEMYGDITFKIGSDEITANMGDNDDPGLVYDNNSITHVNIGVTENFSLSGLQIETNDLGVEWNSGSDFYLYGDANLSIESETVETDFGTSSDPGVVIKNGSLHSFEVDVNSDLTLGNLEVKANDVDIKYSSSKFEVTGEIEITEVFSLTVDLGSGDQAGLEIDVSGSEPTFKIDDLTIDIEHANLGTIDLKNFKLEFDSNGIVESDVDVIFPSGTEIDADLKFTGDPAKLDAIDISYRADNLTEALELFEGVQVAYLDGSVSNLTHTSDLKISATIETIYGGGFTLDGKSATLLEMRDEVTITKSSFDLDGDVKVGAYRSGTDSWHDLLGSGSVDLYTKFGHYIKATVKVDIPGDPLVKADATVYTNSDKDFDALVDVTFYVPHSIPIIGGKKLGSVDGAIRYKHNDLNGSYAAGWERVKTFWHTYHLGAKYKFGSRSVSTFSSSSTIDDIKDDISNDEKSKSLRAEASEFVQSAHTFNVFDDPTLPNMMMVDANWGTEIDSVLLTVIGPEGIYELTRVTIVSENDSTTLPDLGYEENTDWVTDDTSAVFLFTTPATFSEEEQVHAKMMAGRYQVIVSIPQSQFADSVDLSVYPVFQSPTVDLAVSKSSSSNIYEIDADYWSTLPDSSFISIYVNDSTTYDSALLIQHIDAANFDDNGYGTESLAYAPSHLDQTDTLWFFAVIDDGINPPQYSDISTSYIHTPDLYGMISFPAEVDSLNEGVRIFVDADTDSSFDVASTGGLELFGISGEDGVYALTGLENGTHELRLVLPPGYRISGTTDRYSETKITFEGEPIELNISIEAYTEEEEE